MREKKQEKICGKYGKMRAADFFPNDEIEYAFDEKYLKNNAFNRSVEESARNAGNAIIRENDENAGNAYKRGREMRKNAGNAGNAGPHNSPMTGLGFGWGGWQWLGANP